MLLTLAANSASAQTTDSVVLRAARVINGTGRSLRNQDATVQGGRITAMRASAGPLPAGGLDLGARTLLPELIDTHVHRGWYVTDEQRLHEDRDGDTPDVSTLQRADNAVRRGATFASTSIRDGGEATMTPKQLNAACGEATAQGLRSVVHAHSAMAGAHGRNAEELACRVAIGLAGDLIEAMQRVSFVMQGGRVYRNVGAQK